MNLVDIKHRSAEEVEKSQFIRGLDILILAPYLFYLAVKKSLSPLDVILLLFIAFFILWYNLNNYIKNVDRIDGQIEQDGGEN